MFTTYVDTVYAIGYIISPDKRGQILGPYVWYVFNFYYYNKHAYYNVYSVNNTKD